MALIIPLFISHSCNETDHRFRVYERIVQTVEFSRKSFFIFGFLSLVQGCTTYGQYASSMRDGLVHGRPELSLAIAEKKDPEQEEVISSLDKGILRRINQDYSGSNEIFEVAKKEIEKLYGISITENLASVTINETLRGYEGDRYEQLLLHAYMAMNYIQLGRLDDARVEMLQANVKMMEWGEAPEEDAFIRYLEGIIYESLGEEDNALISYRKAYSVYKKVGKEKYPPVPEMLKKDLLRLTSQLGLKDEYKSYQKEFSIQGYRPQAKNSKNGELIVLLNNGLAPIRQEASVYIFSTEVQQNLRVAFPVYRSKKARLKQAVVAIDGEQFKLEAVEDIDKLARQALDEAMPGIMARATARAVVKYNTQHQAENNGSLAGLLMTVTNLATERADTRSWSTLPQEIDLARVSLPAGEYPVQLQLLNQAGRVVDTFDKTIDIKPGKSSFFIRHWTAPLVKQKSMVKNKDNKVDGNVTDETQAKQAVTQ